MNTRTLLRVALGYLAISSAQIGFWALLAPQSFYDHFPGFGRTWISIDGPYNEHLIRDFGALNLALLVVLVWAAVRLSRELVTMAAVATAVWVFPTCCTTCSTATACRPVTPWPASVDS